MRLTGLLYIESVQLDKFSAQSGQSLRFWSRKTLEEAQKEKEQSYAAIAADEKFIKSCAEIDKNSKEFEIAFNEEFERRMRGNQTSPYLPEDLPAKKGRPKGIKNKPKVISFKKKKVSKKVATKKAKK